MMVKYKTTQYFVKDFFICSTVLIIRQVLFGCPVNPNRPRNKIISYIFGKNTNFFRN